MLLTYYLHVPARRQYASLASLRAFCRVPLWPFYDSKLRRGQSFPPRQRILHRPRRSRCIRNRHQSEVCSLAARPHASGAHAPFRWLAIRLDFLGGIMTFIVSARGPISQGCITNMVCQVAILAVSNASGIDPAQIGLVLTYTSTF